MRSRPPWRNVDVVCVVILAVVFSCAGDLVILNAQKRSPSSDREVIDQLQICAMRRDAASPGKDDKLFSLVYLNRTDGCRELDPATAASLSHKAAYLWLRDTPQCSLAHIASNVETHDPAMIVIGTNGPLSINKTLVNLSLPYVFMPDEFAQKLSNFLIGANQPSVYLQPDTTKFDASLLVIWLIAVTTILLGALWTLHEFKMMIEHGHSGQSGEHLNANSNNITINNNDQSSNETRSLAKQMNSSERLVNNSPSNSNTVQPSSTIVDMPQTDADAKQKAAAAAAAAKQNPITIHIGYFSVLVLLVIVVAMILLLYFFYSVMIYFVFAIFCLGSASAIYRIGCLFLSKRPAPLNKAAPGTLRARMQSIDFRKTILAILSIVICVVWFVYRHKSWSWIIQDLMAFSLAVNALSYYRISTYKTVTIILTLFFLYDVFMVFITPAFTKGTSIMEAVAFGGRDVTTNPANDWNNIQFGSRVDTTNKLPVVIIIPHMGKFKRLCSFYYDYSVSLLGLGDILIPGLSTNYAIIFDYAKYGRISVYFVVNLIAYLLGLFLAFVALILMNTAQPALFYLCPVLIICSLLTSILRKEFHSFWSGDPIHKLIAGHPDTHIVGTSGPSTNATSTTAGSLTSNTNADDTVNLRNNSLGSSIDESANSDEQNKHSLRKQNSSSKPILSEIDD